tara:strand:+ start:963 stop:3725 length:2763 start_codon:yes stop_codon:yes gene_type:complete
MKTIAQFKEENPIYQNEPDVKLASFIYDKYYKDRGVDEDEFFKQAFPNIAERKETNLEQTLSPEVDGIISPDDEMLNFDRQQNMSFVPSVKDIAIENDIGTSTGASAESRFAASLGYDDKNKALAIKNVLSDLYKTDITVRTGSNTGELEFLNPETKKFELVNKPGIELGDFTGQGGNAMVILPDIAATIAATVYSGGNLPAGITAGAFTAGVAEYGKYILGKELYGINKDVSNEQLLNRAFVAAGVSAGSGVLGVGAAKVIKATANLVKGRFLQGNDIAISSAEDAVIKADAVAKDINNALDKAKINSNLKFTLGQAADDADMLAAQEAFENVNKLGYMNEFRTFNQNQADALNKYFGFLKSGFGTNTKGASEFEAGTLIQEVIKKQNQPLIKELVEKQANAEEVLEKAIIRLPDGSSKETGVAIRSSIDEASKLYKKNVAEAAENLKVAANVKNVETNIIKKTIENISENQKNNLMKLADVKNVFNKKLLDSNSVNPEVLRNTKSSIQSLIRDKIEGKAAGESVEVKTLQTIVSSINKQIKNSAPKEYLDALDEFNTLVTKNKKLLNNELISKITKVDDNRLKIFDDEDIFSLSFKKDKKSVKYANEVYNVIKDSPDAMKAYRNSINDFYKTKVIKNGKINKNAHESFLRDYDAPLKLFFNKTDYDKIAKLGGFQKAVDDATKLREKTIKDISDSFAGKLDRLTPQELVDKIYKAKNINEVRLLKKILAKDPEVFAAFQKAVLTDLSESVLKTSDRLGMQVIDAMSFDKYLYGAGERGHNIVLREIFDKEFVNNLDLLNRALKISSRRQPPKGMGVFGSAFSDIIRARLGQFTFSGRLFTAGRRIYAKAAERVMANALLNPTSLRELIELRKLKPDTEKAILILSKLDGSIFIKDKFEDAKPFTYISDLFFGDARSQE